MTEHKTSGVEEHAQQLFQLLNEIGIVNQLSSNAFNRLLPDGLTVAQFSVLNNFVRLGGTRTPAGLASAFQVTRGTMTNTLGRLSAAGLVRIEADPNDGRGKIVSITARGRRMRERCVRDSSAVLLELFGDLDRAQVEAALPLLRTLRERFDRDRDSTEG